MYKNIKSRTGIKIWAISKTKLVVFYRRVIKLKHVTFLFLQFTDSYGHNCFIVLRNKTSVSIDY